MPCAEETRLRLIYKAAVRAWSLNRYQLTKGVFPVEAVETVPKQLLSARLKAANDLYDHTVRCPSCRMTRIHLIDDD